MLKRTPFLDKEMRGFVLLEVLCIPPWENTLIS